MALWDRVLSGFNLDDETVNFGTRIIAENNGSLYETCTMATIQSREQVDQKPNVSASIQHSKLFVAIDKSITIFQDETCDKVFLNASFPHPIICYCTSNDGLFLFVMLTSRTLCCFHIYEKKLLSMIPIPDNQANVPDNIIDISFKKQEEETFVILVSNTGAIYKCPFKYSCKDVENASPDINQVAEYAMDIQCSQLFPGFACLEFLSATADASSEELSITVVGANSIFTWPSEQCNNFGAVFSFGYKKIKQLNSSGKMLCLRTDHVLSVVCPDTLLGLKLYDGPVFDFTIVQNDNVNYSCEILFLTRSESNDNTYKLCLVSYPDFEQKLEINVPTAAYLFENLHNSSNISYIEGVAAESGVVDTFRVKIISESIPEMRLARLLSRRQFDAAEAFAEKFSLSVEPIHCSKAALYVEQFAPWTKSTSDSACVSTLIDILDRIQNVQYITECCSKALLSDYTQLRQLYLYARERIVQDMKRGNADDQLNANLSLINNTLHRLETFQMIQDTEADDTSSLNVDTAMNKWIKFSQVNLLHEFNVHLRMGQLKSATLIWTRHLPDIMERASVETVRNIFTILPDDLAPSCLWPWLTHFIPTVLSLLPDAMDEIVSWGLKKLKYLEISHCKVWPEIGTDFAEKFIRLLKFEDNQQSVYFHQEYKYQNSLLKQLMLLLQALSDIQQLKVAYRLRVPLSIYVDSPVEATYMLLDRIHLDEIPDFMNTFLKQYMLNNNLQNDSVLCTFIQKTVKNSSSWWIGEEVAWERRVAVIIDFIYNLENRLEQTLEVLKRAPVPWSSTISTLAETSSNFDHSLSSKIKLERDYIPKKIVLKKYGYMTIGVNNRLISRIIKEDRDSMISDIDVLAKNDQQLRQDAFSRCISARLNEGNLQKAMDIIYHLEDNIADALHCYEGIVNYIITAFSLRDVSLEILGHHVEILGCLELKIHNLSAQSKVDVFFSNDIIGIMRDLKSLYVLRKNYQVDASWKSYRTQKSLVLQKCITKLLSGAGKNDLSAIHKMVTQIAALLGFEKSHATLSLLKQVKDTDAMQQLIDGDDKNPDVTPDEFEDMNEMCLCALRHAAADTDTVEIVKSLSASMLNTCRDNDLPAALSLHTCVNVCPTLPVQRYCDEGEGTAPKSSLKLYAIYEDQAISLDKRLLSLFKDAMSLQLCHSGRIDDGENTDCNSEQMDGLLGNFLMNTRELQHQHNDYSLLRIFETFYFAYCSISAKNENALAELRSALSQLLLNLLRKLCTGRSFDLHLGLACLFMLPDQEACSWISTACASFEADHIRHSKALILGYEYSYMGRNRSLMQKFDNYKLLHIWAQRLSQYSITYREMFTSDTSSKREILQNIISNSKKSAIPILKNYCYNFGFNFTDCLLLYLQKLLKTWNPTITISSLNKELLVCEEEVDSLKRECEAVAAEIEDKSVLKQWISMSWERINFYHYEVFIILMDLIGDRDMKKRNYLRFLQNYTRSGSPTSTEHNEWIQFNPEHSTLPPIAQWRLPFLLKVDFWKLITPELNLRTYEKWLSVARVLNLEMHLVCTLAIKGEVTHVWGNNLTRSKDPAAWSLNPKNTTLLKDIKRCIQRITDSDGFYYGTAALYYVVNHTPPGADRVAAAKECYEYSQLAAQNSTKFEEGMLEKIESKYLRFSSEHILRTHGLEKDKYFALIESPGKLVRELYRDESIPSRCRSATSHRPDINAAVDELCELFSLNTIKLRLELLQEWLRSSNPRYADLSQSFTEILPTMRSDQNTEYEDNLLRASYMLECENTLFAQFLVNIGFDGYHGEAEYDCDMRYRALRVLQTIVDTATLEKLSERDINTFRKYVKSLQYISRLDSLGLRYNIDTFETCSKRELVQILWKSQRHSPYALSVIAQISIEFGIYDILLWDGVLSQMTRLRMTSELKRILLQGRSQSVIVNCNGYRMGWQLIISEPFSEMEVTPSAEQVNNCVEAIRLLYSCPIAHELDFSAITRNCFHCQQMCLAAALLPFLNETERQFALQVINRKSIAELTEGLNDLSSKGVLTIARSLAIVQKSVP
ncbi:PREDICTED: kinetochore-associated protein 1 [Dinoponera quadriceps]|uniref:Kinetochore-associated protein 1 n=1 Tax=Dinoponera quadriceps TaxID=609295 RepID=A0A6P3X1E6_DINQU|nr:PREDICTED: kinetochore-associated protein 1 [Dinoponera quadriceps]